MLKNLFIVLSALSMLSTLYKDGLSGNIQGDYVAELKVVDFLDESDISTFSDMGIDISDLSLDVNIVFEEDDSFVLSIDAETFESDFSCLLESNMDEIIDLALEDIGMTRDDITDDEAQSIGYDSADEMFSDIANQIMTEMESYYEEMEEEFDMATVSGFYEVSGNTIIFTLDEDDASFEQGIINVDRTISIYIEDEDISTTLVFSKQD
ncbi:hypothetical protein [Pseudobutyrivibrio ruminis]|uniref:Uncharacterized protein n=1 Tax=Pseudobutyrivibrio ruminis TaxID=46206 RepID=A0A2G3DYC4_9FIRM|nr:hypothetical protein [Pseudobutyrivibrio ruminis]PHU36052.1 hypothetical protein CSX01_02135 [Pseudobutyrivibrio ruminis]